MAETDKPNPIDNLITRMKTINATTAAPIVAHGPLSDQVAPLAGTGVAAGRKVWDNVTGQWVTVVGSTTAYLPQSVIDEVNNAG